MARIRYLKPDFFKDEDLAILPFEARLFFAGLWNFADKAGRLEDRPLRLKVEIFPYDKVDVDKCLDLLSKPKNGSQKPFIQRYEVNGEKYIQIINWDKHQKPHNTEKESTLPKPPPLTTPVKETDKGNGKGVKHVPVLSNVSLTVKQPLITHPPFVIISPEEYQELINTYGLTLTKKYIEDLNIYAAQKPKKFKEYASHYATVQAWMRRDNIKKLEPRPQIRKDHEKEMTRDPKVAEMIHQTVRNMK